MLPNGPLPLVASPGPRQRCPALAAAHQASQPQKCLLEGREPKDSTAKGLKTFKHQPYDLESDPSFVGVQIFNLCYLEALADGSTPDAPIPVLVAGGHRTSPPLLNMFKGSKVISTDLHSELYKCSLAWPSSGPAEPFTKEPGQKKRSMASSWFVWALVMVCQIKP